MSVELGQVWRLGEHRLMCGDATSRVDMEILMEGMKATLCFADPPYGVKKESEGVLNDNLNQKALVNFNKKWIPLSLDALTEIGSWYCWGCDESVLDIYSEVIRPMIQEGELTLRNLLTWDKGIGQNQRAASMRSYPFADEKCLFVMKGRQVISTNSDNYWEGWEPLRSYLDAERQKMGWDSKMMVRRSPWPAGALPALGAIGSRHDGAGDAEAGAAAARGVTKWNPQLNGIAGNRTMVL